MVRVALVGTGMIGAVHARAARVAGARVAGVLASTAARSKEVAEAWDVPAGYPDFAAVLADDRVDVVHLCTPNVLHASQTEAALRAGKHVICEKPLATSPDDAERVTALARDRGLVLAVPFVYRYHPMVREIRHRARQGDFGRWQLLHGSYLQDWMLPASASSWRVDPAVGGPSRAFADIGSHWCDLVEWVAGVRFGEVIARLTTTIGARPAGSAASFSRAETADPLVPVRTEDAVTMLMSTVDGISASLTVSQVSAGRKNRLWFELDGAAGSAVFDQENPESVWLGDERGARLVVRDPGQGAAGQRRLSFLPAGHSQGYADCFAAFMTDAYAAVAGDVPDGLPTGADGVRSARLVDAVLHSHETSGWTKVEGTR